MHRCRSCARSPPPGKLPVVLFCAGGIATPADASLVMQLGAEGVFVGSGIFKSEDPARRARAIVEATTHYADPARVAAASTGLGAGDGRASRPRSSTPSSCSLRAAGECGVAGAEPLVGVLALQGGFEAHARCCSGSGRRRARCGCPPISTGSTRSCSPAASRR